MEGKQVLLIAEAVQNEKDVSADDIFEALEAALAAATRRVQSDTMDVRVAIDRQNGEYRAFRRWQVLDDEDPEFMSSDYQVLLTTAKEEDDSLEEGDYIEEEIETPPFNRITAHTAKQVILQKLREAERSRIVKLYKPQIGRVLMGSAKRHENPGLYVDFGSNIEGFIPREEMIPNERVRIGQRVRAHLFEVREDMRGPQLLLSRITPEFLTRMFEVEVLEVGQGLIEIMGAARDPGVRAKVAVRSNDPRLDPVGACVGMRGSRVQSISNEVAEEKIDIIPWNEDPILFATSAMSPAPVDSIVADETRRQLDVAVDESKLSLAIGRGGQNVRLASKLLGWHINVITIEQAAENKIKEASKLSKMFYEELNVDEEVANILVQEGFNSIEEIAYIEDEKLLAIAEFDEKIVDEMRSRARNVMLTLAISSDAEESPKGGLMEVEGMEESTAQLLIAHDIKTLQDLADQAVDDLLEVPGISRERAAELIMAARKPMFEEDSTTEESLADELEQAPAPTVAEPQAEEAVESEAQSDGNADTKDSRQEAAEADTVEEGKS